MPRNRWHTAGSKAVQWSLNRLPERAITGLEEAAQRAQGKGGGANTTKREVSAGLSLLPRHQRATPMVFDVGAHRGDWAAELLYAAPDADLTCFEPGQTSFLWLSQRLAGAPNVKLVNSAVGRTSGRARLWSDAAGSTLASLTQRNLTHLDTEFAYVELVDVVTLDDWCQRLACAPDFIKLDIEGTELEALEGGRRTLQMTSVVQFEFGGCNIDSRTFFHDFWIFFQDLSFDVFRLGPRGLRPVENYRERDETFSTSNFFAVRSDLRSDARSPVRS